MKRLSTSKLSSAYRNGIDDTLLRGSRREETRFSTQMQRDRNKFLIARKSRLVVRVPRDSNGDIDLFSSLRVAYLAYGGGGANVGETMLMLVGIICPEDKDDAVLPLLKLNNWLGFNLMASS